MNILSFEEFKKRVHLLKGINSELSKDEVNQQFFIENNKLTKENEQFFLASSPVSTHPEKNKIFYRATNSYDGFDENKIKCFKYPEEPSLKRCNIPKYPVFYCSDEVKICVSEYINEKGNANLSDFVYISEWKVSIEKKWKVLPFIFSNIPSENAAFKYSKTIGESLLNKYKNLLPTDDIDKYINFYHKVFRSKKNYAFSSIISHKFLNIEQNDILVYPSVQFNSLGNNYAFNKKWIEDKTIYFHKTYKCKIENYSEGHYKCICLEEGFPKKDKIEWKKFNDFNNFFELEN